MRLTGLLAVLLFILIVFFAAPAASFAQTASEKDRPLALDTKSEDALLKAMRSFAGQHVWELERDGVCYTLRTYVMARDEKDSDTTHLVRETRCLPAAKLQFKTAIAPRPIDPAAR
jgi:Co/Zn/Cd efflux system component